MRPLMIALTLVLLVAIGLSYVVVRAEVVTSGVGAAASIFVAAGTLILALVTLQATSMSRRNFEESQRAQNRPLLVPANTLGLDEKATMGPSEWLSFWSAPTHSFNVENVGSGVALDACGVILPPKEPGANWVPTNQYFVRLNVPIQESARVSAEFEIGNTIFTADDRIANVPMGVPKDRAPGARVSSGDRRDRVVLRMTLSYRDVSLHRHATVFDLTPRLRWVCVAVLPNIEKDILDLDDQKGK